MFLLIIVLIMLIKKLFNLMISKKIVKFLIVTILKIKTIYKSIMTLKIKLIIVIIYKII